MYYCTRFVLRLRRFTISVLFGSSMRGIFRTAALSGLHSGALRPIGRTEARSVGFLTVLRPLPLTDGHIDIIEGINNQVNNQFAIHTTEGCYHDKPTNQVGFNIDTNCSTASGCTVGMTTQNTYMSGFASAGGGVYATQYDTAGIL